MNIETIATFAFFIGMAAFLYSRRKKIAIQKIFYPVLYFVMYRTKIGLKLMDKYAKKFRKTIKVLSFIGIIVGFAGMLLLTFELGRSLYTSLAQPEAPSPVALVLPFETQAEGVVSVPFFHWIISIFIIAVVHEYAHGVVARAYDIKIKSSGFAFLSILIPIIPAAFVEPDEKIMPKRPKKQQLSVLAAGAFANILLAIVSVLVLVFAVIPIADSLAIENGIEITKVVRNRHDKANPFPAELAGVRPGETIKSIDNEAMLSALNFTAYMSKRKPGELILMETDKGVYNIKLGSNPKNESRPYIGVSLAQSFDVKPDIKQRFGFLVIILPILLWFVELLRWLFLLNIGIGLFNLVPIGPIDGGRMSHLVLTSYLGKKNGEKWWKYISFALLALIILLFIIAMTK